MTVDVISLNRSTVIVWSRFRIPVLDCGLVLFGFKNTVVLCGLVLEEERVGWCGLGIWRQTWLVWFGYGLDHEPLPGWFMGEGLLQRFESHEVILIWKWSQKTPSWTLELAVYILRLWTVFLFWIVMISFDWRKSNHRVWPEVTYIYCALPSYLITLSKTGRCCPIFSWSEVRKSCKY
jgi:hypothetical protein